MDCKLNYVWAMYHYSNNDICIISDYFGPKNGEWYMSLISEDETKQYLLLCRRFDRRKVNVSGKVMISTGFKRIDICLKETLDVNRKCITTDIPCPRYDIRQVTLFEVDVQVLRSQVSSVQTDIAFYNSLDSNKLNPICNISLNADAFRSLSCDMQAMYEKLEQADFILICDSVEIRAHKFILSARSPVLSRMLQHNMKENIDNKMVITDVDASVMKELIFFMYTNRVNEMSYSMALDLFAAAEKYAVLGLKALCETHLSFSLSTLKVLEILISADLYNGKELKENAIKYIFEQFGNIKDTEDWKNFAKEYSYLAVEVLTYITEKTRFYAE